MMRQIVVTVYMGDGSVVNEVSEMGSKEKYSEKNKYCKS